MDYLVSVFDNLSERQKSLIVSNKNMFRAFCEDISYEHNLEIDIVITQVNEYLKNKLDNTIFTNPKTKKMNTKELSYLEMNRQYSIWHKQMVSEPLIKAILFKKYISKGYSVEEIQCFQFDEGEIKYAHQVLNSLTDNFELRKPQVISWESGGDRKDRKKKADLYIQILNLLEDNKMGMSKTGLLRALKKDNGSWRKVSNEVIDYLLSKAIVIKINKKYYLSKNISEKETPYHRKVYESISEKPKSITKMLKELGYNNKKGRERLLKVLDVMKQYDYVEKVGTKWSVIQ
jgi:hypothetical protein